VPTIVKVYSADFKDDRLKQAKRNRYYESLKAIEKDLMIHNLFNEPTYNKDTYL
jgi:hypothetical protein